MSDFTRLEAELNAVADVSKRLRERRLEIGMTQTAMEGITGMPTRSISRIEGGKHAPSLRTLARCAAALHVSVAELLLPVVARSK